MPRTTTPERALGAGPASRVSRTRSVSAQIAAQRRTYAGAVLRSLAKTHHGRPAAQVQLILRSSLSPLGVRLSHAAILQLAADISAGRVVELP